MLNDENTQNPFTKNASEIPKISTRVIEQPQPPKIPSDIVYLDDEEIHGWLEKEPKNYFSAWKRYFIKVEELKLKYFVDERQTI